MQRPAPPANAEGAGKSAPAKISDVARLARVSSATVSRTLVNPGIVTAKTRERVMEAVRVTGYRPHVAARALRVRRTMMALVVVPDIANPFFSEVLRGIDETLSAASYGLIIANLDNSTAKEARYADLAAAGQVDGVLFLCGHIIRGQHGDLAGSELPMVAACEIIPGATFPQVDVNNEEAAEAAVRHLVELGHRRIAYLSGPEQNVLDKARRRGALAALAAAGISRDDTLILPGDFTFRAGAKAAADTLAMPVERRPTALFSANDEMAIGFLKTIHAAGYAAPGDFSIVGFDAIEYADYCEPTLTTVYQPRREIGSRAAELLIDQMTGRGAAPRVHRFEARLMVRASTGPAPHLSRSRAGPP